VPRRRDVGRTSSRASTPQSKKRKKRTKKRQIEEFVFFVFDREGKWLLSTLLLSASRLTKVRFHVECEKEEERDRERESEAESEKKELEIAFRRSLKALAAVAFLLSPFISSRVA
jgi:hypothetical protein